MGRRKSLRKEVVKIVAEGEKSRVHFTLDDKGHTVITEEKFKPNPDLVKFGQIVVGGSRLKMYAFRNNPELVFIRINGEFIPLNKFKLREMVSLVMKGAWFIGLFGKRAKKYRGI